MICPDNNSNYSTLDSTIKQVKHDFQSILVKRKELVLKLGNAFEGAVSDPESICEEIKNTLKEEIAAKLVSARNIEIYCPDKWKRRTRPKNEKTSFSCIQEDKDKTPPKTIAIDTQGIIVDDEESMPINSADHNTKGRLEDNLQRIQKHNIKGTNKLTNREELVDITTFPQYQELLFQNNELKEALEKATQLVQANTIHDNSTVDFEFSLSYEDVQSYVSSRGNINKMWFNGRLDKQTGRVIHAQMGTLADCHKFSNGSDD
jgi:hypothetical protein